MIYPALSQVWVALCIGTAIGLYYYKENRKGDFGLPEISYNWKFGSFILISLSVFLTSLYPSATTFKSDRSAYIKETNENVLRPRYWHQGKIEWEDIEKRQKILENHKKW
jgi:uncharacterized membrane protein